MGTVLLAFHPTWRGKDVERMQGWEQGPLGNLQGRLGFLAKLCVMFASMMFASACLPMGLKTPIIQKLSLAVICQGYL